MTLREKIEVMEAFERGEEVQFQGTTLPCIYTKCIHAHGKLMENVAQLVEQLTI